MHLDGTKGAYNLKTLSRGELSADQSRRPLDFISCFKPLKRQKNTNLALFCYYLCLIGAFSFSIHAPLCYTYTVVLFRSSTIVLFRMDYVIHTPYMSRFQSVVFYAVGFLFKKIKSYLLFFCLRILSSTNPRFGECERSYS